MPWPKPLDEVRLLIAKNKRAEASSILEEFYQALDPSQRTDYVACLLMRGTLQFSQNPAAALEHFENALALAAQSPVDNFGKGQALQGLGACFWAFGEYGKAKQYWEQALPYAEKLDDKELKSYCYGSLGIIYEYQGDLAQAEEYYLKSLRASEEMGSPSEIIGDMEP
jgi:tetratricopeptide (TPR) repeat protein